MNSYAQTNIQLFNQLRCTDYSNKELVYVREAYELATRLFTGLYQPSRKAFIDHLVGTASILASLHRPIEVVTAGLIHAAYLHGDFGSFRRSISDAKRKQVRQAVGEEVEEYIARYTTLLWNRQTISAVRDGLEALGPIDRDVLLMRLANELELYLDLGALHCCNAKSFQQSIERYGPIMVDMADKLGFFALATELTRVFRETALDETPVELRSRSNWTRASLIAPKSYRKQLSLVVWHQLRRLSWVQIVLQKIMKVAGIRLNH